MSYAADMGSRPNYTPSEVQQREREVIDTIARQLDLRPIPENRIAALALGVAWGTEHAYALTDILAELADRGAEPQQYSCQAPDDGLQKSIERALANERPGYMESRTLDGVKTGVVLGDEASFPGGTTQWAPEHIAEKLEIADPSPSSCFSDQPDPAEHTVPFDWISAVADAHYEGRVPQVLQDMQFAPATLGKLGRCLRHAQQLTEAIDHFVSALGKPAPGIFTERLQAVNSYLQQIENEEAGDATS